MLSNVPTSILGLSSRSRQGESEERIAQMVADIDLNGDGTIDKEEWRRAWADGVVSALRP